MSASSILFIGGTRSGKTGLAQRWAEAQAPQRLYLATGQADGEEMAARIVRHQAERGQGWDCLEESVDPVAALMSACTGRAPRDKMSPGERPGVLLLDCVSFWVANLMERRVTPDAILERVEALAAWVAAPPLPVALVSAETGLGMVPISSVGRCFQDILGTANQMLARVCRSVIFVSCGLPLPLKGALPEEIC